MLSQPPWAPPLSDLKPTSVESSSMRMRIWIVQLPLLVRSQFARPTLSAKYMVLLSSDISNRSFISAYYRLMLSILDLHSSEPPPTCPESLAADLIWCFWMIFCGKNHWPKNVFLLLFVHHGLVSCTEEVLTKAKWLNSMTMSPLVWNVFPGHSPSNHR